VVALFAGNDAIAGRLFVFEEILAHEFDGGFGGFGAAGGEVDTATILEIARGDGEDTGGEFFGGLGMELRGVSEGDATRLLGHGSADFGDTVADADDGGLAGGVEVAAAVGRDDPAAFATDGDGIVFAKIAGEKRGGVDSGGHWKIVAERVKGGLRGGWGFGAETQAKAYATSGADVEERATLDGSGEGVGYSFAGWEDELANEIIRTNCIGYGDGERFRCECCDCSDGGRSGED
jgi:hypothetical protein